MLAELFRELLAAVQWYHVALALFFALVFWWLFHKGHREERPGDRRGGPWCLVAAIALEPATPSNAGIAWTFLVVCVLVGLAVLAGAGGLAWLIAAARLNGTDQDEEPTRPPEPPITDS